jgi:hypothetical protein
MNRSFPAVLMIILFIVPTFSAFSDPVSEFNATMTKDGVFYMRGPSFVAPDYGIYEMGGAGSEVIVLSRTSFTDRMAGVPEDYWYLVMYRHCGAEITGYIHGSALRMNPASSVLVFDPPGAVPTPAVPRFVRLTAGASLDKECKKATGTITVPSGKRAVRFRLNYFGGNFGVYAGESAPTPNGFSIAPASGAGSPLFRFEYPEDSGPDEFDSVRDDFFALELEPGAYRMDVSGGSSLTLKITYDLVETP